ncbi:MAG: hypothetical protein JSV37_13435 [Anaerolineaceae bacterium]|nr:MAG: hypothetical protein JSV37_13435 [Anaerolineaceae bacterium]
MSAASRFIRILIIMFPIILPLKVNAQAPGYADITQPAAGEAIFGLVTIEGSADHPSFVSYELSFAYQPNPEDTWFPIMESIKTPVSEGRLGIWDTTVITDGTYQLRLRVWLRNGNALEAFVPDLRVRNTVPTETPTAVKQVSLPSPSLIPVTQTPRPTPIPPSFSDGRAHVGRIFTIGAILGGVSLLLLGGYLFARRSMSLRWAKLRMRRIHWRSDRGRGGRKRTKR